MYSINPGEGITWDFQELLMFVAFLFSPVARALSSWLLFFSGDDRAARLWALAGCEPRWIHPLISAYLSH